MVIDNNSIKMSKKKTWLEMKFDFENGEHRTKLCPAHRQRYPFMLRMVLIISTNCSLCFIWFVSRNIPFSIAQCLFFVHQFQFNSFSIETNSITHQPSIQLLQFMKKKKKERKTINRTHKVCMPNNQISNCQKRNGINRPKIRWIFVWIWMNAINTNTTIGNRQSKIDINEINGC